MKDIAGHVPELFYPAYFERPAVYRCLTCGLTGTVGTFKADPCLKAFET